MTGGRKSKSQGESRLVSASRKVAVTGGFPEFQRGSARGPFFTPGVNLGVCCPSAFTAAAGDGGSRRGYSTILRTDILRLAIYVSLSSEERFAPSPHVKKEAATAQKRRETGGRRGAAVFRTVSPCVRLCGLGRPGNPCQGMNGCVKRLSTVLGWGGVWGSGSRIAPAYHKEKEALPFHLSTGGKDCLEERGRRKNCVA